MAAALPGDPEPPTGVRLELPDGTALPVDLLYEGWWDGAHQWRAVVPVSVERLLTPGARLLCDSLPAHTAIAFGVL